jgi:hypothetical protein
VLLGTAVLVPLVIASLQFVRDRPRVKEAPQPPVRIVACPQVRISTSDLPERDRGWLAAAAATLACDRVRLRLGGDAEHALPPAALVPGNSNVQVLDSNGAGAAQRVVANAHADAIIEGELDQGKDFQITLRLVDRLGNEIGKGNGAHVSLVGAVRMAEDMMSGEAGLSPAPGDVTLATNFPHASLEAILATHDLSVHALTGDAEELDDACGAVNGRSDLGALAATVAQVCEPWGGRPDMPMPSTEQNLRRLFFAAHPRPDLLWLPWQNLAKLRRPEADASAE